MTSWEIIPEFPAYLVSDRGTIQRRSDTMVMSVSMTPEGNLKVGLTVDKHQHHRSVARLVAEAYLPPPINAAFDTPIHLDGNKRNCRVENLMWRPRWFAVRYHQQFKHYIKYGPLIDLPIRNRETGSSYKNSWDLATTEGLLDRDVQLAMINGTYTWPNYQQYVIN